MVINKPGTFFLLEEGDGGPCKAVIAEYPYRANEPSTEIRFHGPSEMTG